MQTGAGSAPTLKPWSGLGQGTYSRCNNPTDFRLDVSGVHGALQ